MNFILKSDQLDFHSFQNEILEYKFQTKTGKRWPSLSVHQGLSVSGIGLGRAAFHCFTVFRHVFLIAIRN